MPLPCCCVGGITLSPLCCCPSIPSCCCIAPPTCCAAIPTCTIPHAASCCCLIPCPATMCCAVQQYHKEHPHTGTGRNDRIFSKDETGHTAKLVTNTLSLDQCSILPEPKTIVVSYQQLLKSQRSIPNIN